MPEIKIFDALPEEEILAQMAEECVEASKAALKLRRARSGVNPTPVSEKDAFENLVEELADIYLCSIVFFGGELDDNDPCNMCDGYLEQCDELPVTTFEAANWCHGCMRADYEELSPWAMAETEVEILELKCECSGLAKMAVDAANKIIFNDLSEFCQDPDKLFEKLLLNKISHTNIENARLLFLEAAAKQFERCIIDEICAVFDEYISCST